MSVADVTMAQAAPLPQEVSDVFQALYQKEPVATQESQDTRYSVPGEAVSVYLDRHLGFHIEIKKVDPSQTHLLRQVIENAYNACVASKRYDCFWQNTGLPITEQCLTEITPSSFILGDPEKGRMINDYQQHMLKICQWLNREKECRAPFGATHNIGGTGFAWDPNHDCVLLIEDLRRKGFWNLPGGSFDPNKDASPVETALRELKEEAGLDVDKTKIASYKPKLINVIEFPKNRLAPAINLTYAFCIDNISEQPLNPRADEIARVKWISFQEFARLDEAKKRVKILEKDPTKAAELEEAKKEATQIDGLKVGEEITGPLPAAIAGRGLQCIASAEKKIVYTELLPPNSNSSSAQ